MMNSREAIVEALCGLLAKAKFATPINGCDTWALFSRRLKLWSDVAGADQPALFVTDHGETVAYAAGSLPGKTVLNVDLLVYIAAGKDPDCVPARDLNVALDAMNCIFEFPVVAGLGVGIKIKDINDLRLWFFSVPGNLEHPIACGDDVGDIREYERLPELNVPPPRGL